MHNYLGVSWKYATLGHFSTWKTANIISTMSNQTRHTQSLQKSIPLPRKHIKRHITSHSRSYVHDFVVNFMIFWRDVGKWQKNWPKTISQAILLTGFVFSRKNGLRKHSAFSNFWKKFSFTLYHNETLPEYSLLHTTHSAHHRHRSAETAAVQCPEWIDEAILAAATDAGEVLFLTLVDPRLIAALLLQLHQ